MATTTKKHAADRTQGAEMRHRLFVQAYITNGGNATEAAKTAGYSHHTAKVQGSRLLTNADVKAALAEHAERAARKYELTTDMVMRSLVQELTFNPADLFDEHGQLKPIAKMDPDTAAVLQGFEVTEEDILQGKKKVGTLRTAKVKWASRQGAREQAMKYLGMFEKDNAQKTPLDGVPREILVALAARLKSMNLQPQGVLPNAGR